MSVKEGRTRYFKYELVVFFWASYFQRLSIVGTADKGDTDSSLLLFGRRSARHQHSPHLKMVAL